MNVSDIIEKWRKNNKAGYVRRCQFCNNIHNWRMLSSGEAICVDCGRDSQPKLQPTENHHEAEQGE